MRSSYLFTSESVSEGHPDKVSDQISDAIVDLFLSKDPEARVACETMTTTQLVVLAGEIRGKGIMDEAGNWAPGVKDEIEATVRKVVKDIGYEQDGFHWKTLKFHNNLHPQSAHIAQGVDASGNKDEGAGDQGIMFGFACDETPDLMPATLDYSHKILERMAADRHSGAAPFLEPDTKSQVTLKFDNGKPVAATAIVVSTQHKPGYNTGAHEAELKAYVKKVIADVIPAALLSDKTVYHINPTGSFEIGGPDGDAGARGSVDPHRMEHGRAAQLAELFARAQGGSLGDADNLAFDGADRPYRGDCCGHGAWSCRADETQRCATALMVATGALGRFSAAMACCACYRPSTR